MPINSKECEWLDSIDISDHHRNTAARLLVRLGAFGHQVDAVDAIDGNVNVFVNGTLFVVQPMTSVVEWTMTDSERSGRFYVADSAAIPPSGSLFSLATMYPPWWRRAT